MQRRKLWLRTDEKADTENSLKKVAQLSQIVGNDPAEWKWLLVATHSATQGMFVTALSLGNGLLTLKRGHAAAWLNAYRNGGPWPPKLDLDYFLELYGKAKSHIVKNGSWQTTDHHDDAMRRLNDLRNGFIHFGAQAWSIEIAGLPSICLRCLEMVHYLGWHSGVVYWRTLAQGNRALKSLRSAMRALRTLDKALS
jgi:hypothetical protein